MERQSQWKTKERISSVVDKLFIHAEKNNPWAIKLVLEYFLTRPQNRGPNNPGETDNSAIVEGLTPIPKENKVAAREILTAGYAGYKVPK